MQNDNPVALPEVWAGLECTVNRVGDVYHDQIVRGGHNRRSGDLDRLAALGIRAVRYPVLWEKHLPDPSGSTDWSSAASRLRRLRELGVRPIVGLVHHGSGPRETSLVDPAFPPGLERFAARVAARFPEIEAYTPINEPLTTARFSGLYGHWYPHGRDPLTFARALLTECRATVLAMRAIRGINPRAQLIQTDDLGETYAPAELQYQADFENERRWLTWDLLCGRVDRRHPMADYFRYLGLPEADYLWFADNPCPPDVIGVNHYVTSNRYLDNRVERYGAEFCGGNGRHGYADVEAIRLLPSGCAGIAELLEAAWDRYRLPLAVTEAHLGCTREEQLRWLRDVWQAACGVRGKGVDLWAVTAWSAFGAYDWDSLVTLDRGHYEPGLFDTRWDPPKPTALADLVREFAAGRDLDHPVLDGPGWWNRPERMLFADDPCLPPSPKAARTILIAGGRGTLGRAFARMCGYRGLAHVVLARDDVDVADPTAVAAALERYRPWAVINAAGYTRIDAAEGDPERCRRENVTGPAVLADACAARRIALVTFSSDFVFDGRAGKPYRENDPVGPLNVYGSSKAEAEREVLARHPGALVIRTGAFFGPWDDRNFVARALGALRGGSVFAAPDDLVVTPSYVPDLVGASLDLMVDREGGIWHLSNPDPVSWADLARQAARTAGLDAGGVVGQPAAVLGWRALRPPFSALASDRGPLLPPLAHALDRYRRDCTSHF